MCETQRYIVGFWLVEMAISTNQKPTIYRNLYENTGPGPRSVKLAHIQRGAKHNTVTLYSANISPALGQRLVFDRLRNRNRYTEMNETLTDTDSQIDKGWADRGKATCPHRGEPPGEFEVNQPTMSFRHGRNLL